VASDGLALRFDKKMRLTGGEDTEFFGRASAKGARIQHVPTAIVHEEIPPSRTRLSYYMNAEARMANNVAYMKCKQHGKFRAASKMLFRAMKNLLRGISRLLRASAAWLTWDHTQGKQMLVDSLAEVSRAYGSIVFFFSLKMQPYRNTHGN